MEARRINSFPFIFHLNSLYSLMNQLISIRNANCCKLLVNCYMFFNAVVDYSLPIAEELIDEMSSLNEVGAGFDLGQPACMIGLNNLVA